MTAFLERKASRDQLQEWAQRGQLDAPALERALQLSGYRPDQAGWRRFVDYTLLAIGALLLISGIFFFFAYNWNELPRFGRFALIEVLLLLAAGAAYGLGLTRLTGKVALSVAALLVGALLAVFGQEYQTGADSYLLFLNWALLIAGWVIISNFDVLWAILLGLANLTLFFYWDQVLPSNQYPWTETLFALNAVALLVWEGVQRRGVEWARQRWLPRLLALVSFGWILIPTVEAIFAQFDGADLAQVHLWAPVLYLCFLAAVLFFYIRWQHDLLVLTLALLSVIIVLTTLLTRWLADVDAFLTFLGLALAVIVQAALAVAGLRQIARTWREQP